MQLWKHVYDQLLIERITLNAVHVSANQRKLLYIQGRRQDFGWGIWIFTELYCTTVALPEFRFGGGGHSAKIYSTKTFKNFWKIYIRFAQNFKNFSKIFQLNFLNLTNFQMFYENVEPFEQTQNVPLFWKQLLKFEICW